MYMHDWIRFEGNTALIWMFSGGQKQHVCATVSIFQERIGCNFILWRTMSLCFFEPFMEGCFSHALSIFVRRSVENIAVKKLFILCSNLELN